jgi:ABC-type transporter Mla subunit MlaD
MTANRWTDEMLDQLADEVRDTNREVKETSRNVQALLRVAQAHQDSLEQLKTSIFELRAGQAQQATILDYLLRKEQERQNGGAS